MVRVYESEQKKSKDRVHEEKTFRRQAGRMKALGSEMKEEVK